MAKPWLAERWWRWGQALAGLLIVAFVARYLVRNWEVVRSEAVVWELRPGWIAASLLLVLATYAVLAESWRRMLMGWGGGGAGGQRLGFLTAARVWVISSMGKYLPGKVWALAGMAVLAARRGISPAAATGSALVLQVVSLGTGALLVGATGIVALEAHRPGIRLALGVILAASAAGLVVVMTPALAGRLLGRFTREPGQRLTPRPGAVGFGIAANLAAWTTYGLALWCLARGTLPSAGLPLTDAVGGFAGSYIAGLLFLLAPGGLGVREGVFVWMLQDRIGPANALALAGVSRIGMTLADVLAALPFVFAKPGAPGKPESDRDPT
ncbi:MAG TPA: lysylphosphatidylglycerol synthase domain-containing protein [Gemmatimonadales bacterium]|nr:lysylphosphatidylglycerol synthase domain-containing protein [Gemmatimonadales bacterium]